jgi:hypothetical protein
MTGLRGFCALLVPAAMVLSSCGGGDSDGNSEGTAAGSLESKEELVAAADAVCVEGAKRVNELFNQQPGGRNPSTPQEFANTLPDRVELEKTTVGDLQAIRPPENLAGAYRRYVQSYGGVVSAYEQALAAANQVDTEAFGRANQRVNASQQANTNAAAELGLQACASHLPADEKAEVNLLTEDIWKNADPAHCTEDYTSAFVEDLGGQVECVKSEQDPSIEADSVEIGEISGVSHVTSMADVTIHGGSQDGDRYSQAFEYEGGRWKLDQLFPLN